MARGLAVMRDRADWRIGSAWARWRVGRGSAARYIAGNLGYGRLLPLMPSQSLLEERLRLVGLAH